MDSLSSLSWTGSPCEATFVFHPACRAFDKPPLAFSSWTHDSKPLGLEMVTQRLFRPIPTHPEMLPRRSRHRDTCSWLLGGRGTAFLETLCSESIRPCSRPFSKFSRRVPTLCAFRTVRVSARVLDFLLLVLRTRMGKEHQLIQRKLRWEKKSEIRNLRRRPADDLVSFFVLQHGFSFFLASHVSSFPLFPSAKTQTHERKHTRMYRQYKQTETDPSRKYTTRRHNQNTQHDQTHTDT